MSIIEGEKKGGGGGGGGGGRRGQTMERVARTRLERETPTRRSWLVPKIMITVCFLTSSSTTRLYRRRAPRQERLTILRAATHETELGDHDFCLSRSHYTDTDPTCRERAATAGIKLDARIALCYIIVLWHNPIRHDKGCRFHCGLSLKYVCKTGDGAKIKSFKKSVKPSHLFPAIYFLRPIAENFFLKIKKGRLVCGHYT